MSEIGVEKSDKTENRIDAIDVAKGFGFFLVVLGHLVNYGNSISVSIFSFHMPLFYMLTGYLLSNKNIGKSYVKRVISLAVCYLSFALIGLFVTLIIPAWRNALSLNQLKYELLYNTQPECIHVGQLWFLASLFWAISLFYLIHRIFQRHELACFIICVLISCASVLLSRNNAHILINGESYVIPFKILPGMCSLVFVETGYLLKKYGFISKVLEFKKPLVLLFSTILLSFSLFIGKINGMVNICIGMYNNEYFYFLSSIIGSIGILLFSSLFTGKIKDIIAFYGKNSMCLFSIHSMFLALYAFLLSIVLKEPKELMINIANLHSLIGAVLIMVFIIPTVFAYKYSIRKLIVSLNKLIE